MSRLTIFVTAISLALGATIASLFFRVSSRSDSESSALEIGRQSSSMPPADRPKLVLAEKPQPKNTQPGFVGADACAGCHRDIHAAFSQTKHPRTCREVREGEMPPGFEDRANFFQTHYDNLSFRMVKEGTRFLQTSIENTPLGIQEHRATLDLVLGAGGTADDVFLTWRDDGQIRELPMAWLYPTQQWAAAHFDPHSGGDYSRATTLRCMECHNTWIEHVPGSENQYRRAGMIPGVTCESCHGPAQSHVTFHQLNSKDKEPHGIVRPALLPRERQIEVCTQCHSNAMRHRGGAFEYRPGEVLDDHYYTLQTQATEDDRVANQISYLRESKCFQKDERMTCVTCHNPHQPPTASNSGNVSCAKCHQAEHCSAALQLPKDIRSDCVACHMPSYLKININFQTSDDNYVPPIQRTEHRIGVYPHAKMQRLVEYYEQFSDADSQTKVQELKQDLVQHFTNVAEACRNEYRFLGAIAALREALRFEDSSQLGNKLTAAVALQTRLDALYVNGLKQLSDHDALGAIDSFEEILKIKPNDAKSHGRLGAEYAKRGDTARAEEHLLAVARCDPNDVFGIALLGWMAHLKGKDEQAIGFYEQANRIEPREKRLRYRTGEVLVGLGRVDDAIKMFEVSLDIDYDQEDVLQAITLALLQSKRAQDAVPYAEHAVRLTNQQNLHALEMLGDVYAAASEPAGARTALQLALEIAVERDPTSVPRLRNRLKTISSP